MEDSFRDDKGRTALAYAKVCGLKQIADLFTQEDLYTKEFLLAKRVSHSLGLDGIINLNNHRISLEGCSCPYMCQTITECLTVYKKVYSLKEQSLSREQDTNKKEIPLFKDKEFKQLPLLTAEDFDRMIEIFSKNSTPFSPQELFYFIQQSSISLLPAFISDHIMMLVFFKVDNENGYMALINRANSDRSQTTKVWQVNFQKFTPQIAEKILNQWRRPIKQGLAFFYNDLPQLLSPSSNSVQDSICSLLSLCSCSKQTAGNCSFAAPMGAVRLIWALLAMIRQDVSPSTLPDLIQRVKEETKSWAFFNKAYTYAYYRKHHSEKYPSDLPPLAKKRMDELAEKNKKKGITFLR